MKILFLSDNFPPEVNAPANRTYEHCVEWVKKGADITVITCVPNFPQGKVYEGYRNKLWQKEVVDGINVIRVWTYISSNQGVFKRILDYVSYAVSSFLAGLFFKTDIIIATSPQFFTAVSGYALALIKKKPWIMEVRDLWPESIKAVDAMKDGWLIWLLEKLELRLYRSAKKVIVVTDSFKTNLVGRGINLDKIEVVKNGVHIESVSPVNADNGLKHELNLKDKFIVAYIGTHGMAHGLDFILGCAPQLPDDVHLLFIGDGAAKDRLSELKNSLSLDNATLLPPVPKSDIAEYIQLSDVALVNLKKSDTFKTVLPSKIFENAALQRPILLGVEGEAKALIEEYGAGLCFEPENKEDFLAKLHKLYSDKNLYKASQHGCLKLAEDFDRKQLAEKMFLVIKETLEIEN